MSESIESEYTDQDAGPGIRLRQARERAGLSCGEVAEQLNLTDGQIAMLEAENYTVLAGPTFVQGYLRSYARLLGLDAAPLLDAYRSQRLAVASAPSVRRRPSLDHGSFQRYLGLAALVLVLVCLWAWQRWSQHTEQQAALPAASAPLVTEMPGGIMPAPAALGLDAGLEPTVEPVERPRAETGDLDARVDGLSAAPETGLLPPSTLENTQQSSILMRDTGPS